MPLNSFKDLIVWQKSMELAREIYRLTAGLPKQELFGLTSQMRRASISIPSNIAEGRTRGTARDFLQFLRVADSSAAELETQLLLTRDLYAGTDVVRALELVDEIQRMLAAMMSRLGPSKLTAHSSQLKNG